MKSNGLGKALFVVFVATMVVSVGALSYWYLGGGQRAYLDSAQDDAVAPETTDEPESPEVDLAPDFNYPAVGGGSVGLSSLIGKVVILDFMATWCGPCESQILNLKQIQTEYAGSGVVIVSIDVDASETEAQLLAFKNELGATWQFSLDADGVGMLPEYSATSIPTMIFIGRDGRIAQRDVGLMSVDDLRGAIDPLL